MTLFLSEGAYRKKRLSKSDYLAGLQCPKYLWLRINEPEAVELEPDANLEALFNQGTKSWRISTYLRPRRNINRLSVLRRR